MLGDYVAFECPINNPMNITWGRIEDIREKLDGSVEYHIVRGLYSIWVREDYIWGPKKIVSVHPTCSNCFEYVNDNRATFFLDCGHVLCEKCTFEIVMQKADSRCHICREQILLPLRPLYMTFNESNDLICARCRVIITRDTPIYYRDSHSDSIGNVFCQFCLHMDTLQDDLQILIFYD